MHLRWQALPSETPQQEVLLSTCAQALEQLGTVYLCLLVYLPHWNINRVRTGTLSVLPLLLPHHLAHGSQAGMVLALQTGWAWSYRTKPPEETSQDSVQHMGKGTISFLPSLPIARHKTTCKREAVTQATGGEGRRPRQQAGSHPDNEGPWDLRKGAKLSKTSEGLQEGLHS